MKVSNRFSAFIPQKLAAFTLIESLSAITILTIAGAATFMTIEWTLGSNPMPLQVQAEAVLRVVAAETQQQKRYIDETFNWNGWQITRTVHTITGYNHCLNVHLTALDQTGKPIAYYDEIIYDR